MNDHEHLHHQYRVTSREQYFDVFVRILINSIQVNHIDEDNNTEVFPSYDSKLESPTDN